MPLAFSDVRKNIISGFSDSALWNGLISNSFSIGIFVSVIILLILMLTYNENKSNFKNMFSFVLYSSIFSTIAFALHDSVLLHNYKLKMEDKIEKNIISSNFNSNKDDARFFENSIVNIGNGTPQNQKYGNGEYTQHTGMHSNMPQMTHGNMPHTSMQHTTQQTSMQHTGMPQMMHGNMSRNVVPVSQSAPLPSIPSNQQHYSDF